MTRGWKGIVPRVAAMIVVITGIAFAADPAADLYGKAQKSLDRGAYREAADAFRKVAAEYPKSRHAGNALYFQAFALYRVGDAASLRDAARALEIQRKNYSDASTGGDASALLVRIDRARAEQGDEEAARRLETRARDLSGKDDRDRKGADFEMQAEALNALMQIEPKRALPLLRKVLAKRTPESVELRRRAVFIVSQLDDPEALPILKEALEGDPDPEVREQAVFWLSQIDGEESLDILLGVFKSQGRPELQEKAIFALSQHGSRKAGEALRNAALDASLPVSVREQAIFWLGQRDDNGDTRFLLDLYPKLTHQELREKVIFSIAQAGTPEGKAWLLGIVRNPAEGIEVRKKALFWAGQEGYLSRADLDALWSSDADPELKDQIIFVLSQQDDEAAIDKLIQIAKTEKNRDLRRKAVFWLGQSDDDRALKFLEQLITNE